VKIKNRQQFLAILAATAILIFVGDKLLFSPLTKAWKARSTRIAALEKSLSQGSLLIERDRTIRERWQRMSTNTLPNNTSAAENIVLRAFDRWSQESRISITSLKPQWKQREDDYMTLECRADAFGDIQAITRFLYELEKDPLAVKVDMIELSARDKDGEQLALGIQVSGLLLSAQEP
jgi:hypothetical protein